MRKRAQRRFKPTFEEPKHKIQTTTKLIKEKKPRHVKKNIWIFATLIAIFLLVLFFNTYFNYTTNVAYNPDEEGLEKYYLSGPDPYYNMRLVEGTYETGRYPYYSEPDPLLNYPLGAKGGRAPLLNMAALGFSRLLAPFMSETDAIGFSMQFIPALFGALLVFPVYFIGKTLFNSKAGLIAALFLAIIPIHIGSGHGSAFSLFDHDSFNLLNYFLTFLFLILSLKEKNSTKSVLYAILGGVSLAALTMTWVEARFLYAVIAIYAIVQIFFDIFTNKIELKVFRTTSILLFSGYLISLPVMLARLGKITLDTPLTLCIAVVAFGALYYTFGKKRIPWTLSLPFIIIVATIGLVFLFFVKDLSKSFPFLTSLKSLSDVIFGSGIYGNKVSMTIAEANTFQISHSVMSFGPTLYWVGWGGFVFLIWQYFKDKTRRDYLFIVILFIIDVWLASTAGRFLNDMVPLIALLGGFVTWFMVDKIDYRQMFRNIKSAGGGLHGIRRGIKIMHIIGILFIGILLILPNVFITLDAATPNNIYQKEDGNWSNFKLEMFGEGFSGAYGLSVNKEIYWSDALNWLHEQDTNISNPSDRPAFISWWDYGFYEVALGDHPAVADNFQDGIPTAANFHTATSEKDAVSVFIVRILEGSKRQNDGKLSDDVVEKILRKYVGENSTDDIVKWMENPTLSPSYKKPIGEEYEKNLSKDYPVGQQWPMNAVYQDIVDLLVNELTDDEITWLYHDLQESTGLSIRYYGVEGYDKQIFNIFAFLADKSLLLVGAPEDDFIKMYYTGYEVNSKGEKIKDNMRWSAQELKEMSDEEKQFIRVTGTDQDYKNDYFDTMFYKTYIGPYQTNSDGTRDFYSGQFQVPCVDMKHFYAEYISNISNPLLQYNFNRKAAVVIAKYYEGAYVNGTVLFNNLSINNSEIVIQKNLSYSSDLNIPIEYDKNRIVSTTNPEGKFNVIAGAGSRLLIRRYPELYSPAQLYYGFPLKIIDLNISEKDAMRKSDNYERIFNVTIEPANISGYVYNNLDNNETYNVSTDEPVKNVDVYLYDIQKFDRDSFINNGRLVPAPGAAPLSKTTTSDENGYYSFTNLLPGYYAIQVFENNLLISTDLAPVNSGNITYNYSKPKLSNLEGVAYYDSNFDGKYSPGEEVKNADVTLNHVIRDDNKNIINQIFVNKTTTATDGTYSFKSITPAIIKGAKLNEYSIKVEKLPDYQTIQTDIFPEENKTLTLNISLDLSPVRVSGTATYAGETVEDATITFEKNKSIGRNTAEDNSTKTDSTGHYVIDLRPGTYNITVKKLGQYNELIYQLTDEITLTKGQGPVTKDFELIKKSVTTTGKVTYENASVENVSINFLPDTSHEGNTATYNVAISNQTGVYAAELTPGNYKISANGESNESGTLYVLEFEGQLTVTEEDISTGREYNIALVRQETR